MKNAARAFTLIEIMVAATIGVVILLGATTLATTMVRASRVAADGHALTTRAELARALIVPRLASIGDGWRVDDEWTTTPFSTTTGAPGEAHCAAATNACDSTNLVTVLKLNDGGTSGADSLKALVPRPNNTESVEVKGLPGGLVLPADCATLPNPVTLEVEGVTSVAWNAGDLVLVSRKEHVSIAKVQAVFNADTTVPAVARNLQLDLGAAAELQFDDGGRTTPCSARLSLATARILPVSVVQLRLTGNNLEIAESRTAAEALTPTFVPALENIDDLQFRVEYARFPKDAVAGAASLCTCETAANLKRNVTFGAGCTCPAGDKVNKDTAVAPAYRVVGLQVGLLVRGDAVRDTAPTAVPGMFNRTATIVTDSFVRHRATFYVGLDNAHGF